MMQSGMSGRRRWTPSSTSKRVAMAQSIKFRFPRSRRPAMAPASIRRNLPRCSASPSAPCRNGNRAADNRAARRELCSKSRSVIPRCCGNWRKLWALAQSSHSATTRMDSTLVRVERTFLVPCHHPHPFACPVLQRIVSPERNSRWHHAGELNQLAGKYKNYPCGMIFD